MQHTKESLPIGSKVRVYDKDGKLLGWGKVEDHEWVASGFVAGFIAFVRMSDGSPMRVPFIPSPEVRLEVK